MSTSTNYFVRHWRGELSLAKSFWLNYILLGVVLAAIGVGLNQAFDEGLISPGALLLSIPVWIAIFVWQAVGCLRAAGNYTGKPARARDAKTIVMLGCIGACIKLSVGLVQGYDAYQTVLKTPYAIDGPSRREFVRGIAEGCVKKGRTDMTPEQVSKYCRCMGNAFADTATPTDLRNASGQDIDAVRSRMAALVEKCI
jgi:hypothetical protein